MIVASLSTSTHRRMLLLFIFLQLLDFTTTILVFARGGVELNPVIRQFMPLFGAIGGVLASKILICLLVWRFNRHLWLLYAGNTIYVFVVAWNTLMVVAAR
jgi:hypothetical protein